MELHLGAQVRNREGHILGALQRIAYEPEERKVVSLVVLTGGLSQEEVVVPFATVSGSDDESVELRLAETDYASLDIFSESRNIAPPPDSAEVSSDLVQDPVNVPDVPPIGAATGVESIAFIPIVEELNYLAPGQQVMDNSTTVWATDGEVGRVASALVADGSDQLEGFLVHRGAMFQADLVVPIRLVENLLDDTVVLQVSTAQLEPNTRD